MSKNSKQGRPTPAPITPRTVSKVQSEIARGNNGKVPAGSVVGTLQAEAVLAYGKPGGK